MCIRDRLQTRTRATGTSGRRRGLRLLLPPCPRPWQGIRGTHLRRNHGEHHGSLRRRYLRLLPSRAPPQRPALTLENIQELADDSRRAEKEEQDMNALRDEHVRVVGKGGVRQRNLQNNRNRGQTSGKRPCNRCGKDNHTTSECTISRSVKCSKCDKLGHIGPACRGGKPWQPPSNGKQTPQSRARQVGPSEQEDTSTAGSESAQAVSHPTSHERRSPSPAFYV